MHRVMVVAILAIFDLLGCGEKAACIEGQSSVCACPTGEVGAQVCNSTGTFGTCSCKRDVSKRDRAPSRDALCKIAVDKIATDWYNRWQLKTNEACPKDLNEVGRAVNASGDDLKDPWGRSYKFVCGSEAGLPNGLTFGVMSLGEDGKQGTADDIKSWERSRDGYAKRSGAAAEALGKIEGFSKAMCECRDKACADKVNDEYTKWGTEMAKKATAGKTNEKPDPERAKKMTDAVTKYSECFTKLAMAGR